MRRGKRVHATWRHTRQGGGRMGGVFTGCALVRMQALRRVPISGARPVHPFYEHFCMSFLRKNNLPGKEKNEIFILRSSDRYKS
jgi:hypothetical protein